MQNDFFKFKFPNVSYGAPSEGSGGATDDPGFLGTIVLDSDDDHGDGHIVINGNTVETEGSHDSSVNWISVEVILNELDRDNTNNDSLTLDYGNNFLQEHRSDLKNHYNEQDDLIKSLTFGSGTASEIRLGLERVEAFMDFYNAEQIEWYDGLLEDYEISQLITDEHLIARELVEGGKNKALATMLSEDVKKSDLVVFDDQGNYTEIDLGGALVSANIDVSNGLMIIDPGTDRLPNFAIPVREGMNPYESDSIFYHDYDSSVSVPLNGYDALRYSEDGLDALQEALINNPTPGQGDYASENGVVNDVGNLTPLDGDDNFVYSFVVENPDENQSDIVVNYTIDGEHVLSDGYVARMIERYDLTPEDPSDANYMYSLITFGEGDAFIQGALEDPAELVADYEWYQNSFEIFGVANDSLM